MFTVTPRSFRPRDAEERQLPQRLLFEQRAQLTNER